MTNTHRRQTVSDGQLLSELRSRDLSDFLDSKRAALFLLIRDIGEPCWASGPTAAALHGFEGFSLRTPFHVTVPRDRSVRRIGHVVHRSDDVHPIDRTQVGTIAALSPTRTLIDLAATTPAKRLGVAIESAINNLQTTETALRRRIEVVRSSGKYGLPALVDLLDGSEVERGGTSWLEREFLRLVAAAGLPRPSTQQVLGQIGNRLIRVDFRFPGTPIVVETFGYRWHRTVAQISIDAARFNRLTLDGYVPLQFTYAQVVEASSTIVEQLREALSRWDGG